jgi:hypothetical protein
MKSNKENVWFFLKILSSKDLFVYIAGVLPIGMLAAGFYI